jgi:hypothetical protein
LNHVAAFRSAQPSASLRLFSLLSSTLCRRVEGLRGTAADKDETTNQKPSTSELIRLRMKDGQAVSIEESDNDIEEEHMPY